MEQLREYFYTLRNGCVSPVSRHWSNPLRIQIVAIVELILKQIQTFKLYLLQQSINSEVQIQASSVEMPLVIPRHGPT